MDYVPYCGTPPLPADWLGRWNLDPWLLLGLALLLALHEFVAARVPAASAAAATRRRTFRAGWALLAFGLVSPLCALSVALFSARVTQHLLLLFIAVPLMAYGWQRAAGPRAPGLGVATVALTAAFWFWHAPAAYEATFTSTAGYWAMHVSLLAAAWFFWRAMFSGTRGSELKRLGALGATLAQMGLLGALLTFATRLLYSPHVTTTAPFGLTALEDQQLGGLVMWVPGGLVPLVVALALVARLLTHLGDADANTPSTRA